MPKQKVVIRTAMHDAKARKKALKTAVELSGVISAAVEDDTIIVVGDGLDSVALTVMLRKQLGYADLHRVAPLEKDEKKRSKEISLGNKRTNEAMPGHSNAAYVGHYEGSNSYQVHDDSYPNGSCCVM